MTHNYVLCISDGPDVESTMTLTLLHTRDAGPNVQFRVSFNVSRGLPSRIACTRDGTTIHSGRGVVSGVNYEVLSPLYVSSSQPEITRVSFEEMHPRVGATYSCTVYVEGRVNITSGTYNFDQLGSATSTVTVTGECDYTDYNYIHYSTILISSPVSCRHPHWCHCYQEQLQLCSGLLDCSITTTSWL